jgi:hypothetical protein
MALRPASNVQSRPCAHGCNAGGVSRVAPKRLERPGGEQPKLTECEFSRNDQDDTEGCSPEGYAGQPLDSRELIRTDGEERGRSQRRRTECPHQR